MYPVTITPNSNHTQVKRLAGFSLKESAGIAAVATVNIRDTSAGGQILFHLELAANESLALVLGDTIPVQSTGVYVEVVAGTVSGTLFGK